MGGPFEDSLRQKCLYLELFWSVFSPNAGKYGPEQLRTRTLFTQWTRLTLQVVVSLT